MLVAARQDSHKKAKAASRIQPIIKKVEEVVATPVAEEAPAVEEAPVVETPAVEETPVAETPTPEAEAPAAE